MNIVDLSDFNHEQRLDSLFSHAFTDRVTDRVRGGKRALRENFSEQRFPLSKCLFSGKVLTQLSTHVL